MSHQTRRKRRKCRRTHHFASTAGAFGHSRSTIERFELASLVSSIGRFSTAC